MLVTRPSEVNAQVIVLLWSITGCEALTIPMDSTTSLPSMVPVRLASRSLGSEPIPGLGSPITFYVWSSTDVTLFLSDYILSPVEDWYSNCDDFTPQYQPAEVAVWATFTNQIAQLDVTADVSSFVHNVSQVILCKILYDIIFNLLIRNIIIIFVVHIQ